MVLGVLPRWQDRPSSSHYIVGAFGLYLAGALGIRFVQIHQCMQNYSAVLQLNLSEARALDADQQARLALDELLRMLDARRALLVRISEQTGLLQLTAGRDSSGIELSQWQGYDTLVEQVQSSRRAICTRHIDPLPSKSQRFMAAPLSARVQLLGVLCLEADGKRRAFQPDDQEFFVSLG